MFEAIRSRVLRIFRVPHDPDPPTGAPGSVRVFRAGRNFYKLRLVRWGIGQIGALAGIIVSLQILEKLEAGVESARFDARQSIAAPASVSAPSPATTEPAVKELPSTTKANAKSRDERARAAVRKVAERWPRWLFRLLMVLEWFGILLYLVQIPITYAMVRLDFELRWYIVTDRSLRIRAGLASVQESTMSFANVQQVIVTQGPLQRLLGIADLRVQSAGGGGDHQEHRDGDSLHTGVFHGVENANEIRDLILERLRAFRQAGLGDPDDPHADHRPADNRADIGAQENLTLVAAQELLQETRMLRQTLAS